jgi:hypothetical protein
VRLRKANTAQKKPRGRLGSYFMLKHHITLRSSPGGLRLRRRWLWYDVLAAKCHVSDCPGAVLAYTGLLDGARPTLPAWPNVKKTVVRFERGELEGMHRRSDSAYAQAGVIFIDADNCGPEIELWRGGRLASKVPPPTSNE